MDNKEIKRLVELTGGIIPVGEFIKIQAKGVDNKEIAFDNIVLYNEMLDEKPVIDMFTGDDAIFKNFEFFKLDGKLFFKSTDAKGKLHMFTYDMTRKVFFGKETLRDMADMGILAK